MARHMAEDDKLYRAVIVKVYEAGHRATFIHGPFTAKAPATSVINEEKHKLAREQEQGWRWQGPYTLEYRTETCEPDLEGNLMKLRVHYKYGYGKVEKKVFGPPDIPLNDIAEVVAIQRIKGGNVTFEDASCRGFSLPAESILLMEVID